MRFLFFFILISVILSGCVTQDFEKIYGKEKELIEPQIDYTDLRKETVKEEISEDEFIDSILGEASGEEPSVQESLPEIIVPEITETGDEAALPEEAVPEEIAEQEAAESEPELIADKRVLSVSDEINALLEKQLNEADSVRYEKAGDIGRLSSSGNDTDELNKDKVKSKKFYCTDNLTIRDKIFEDAEVIIGCKNVYLTNNIFINSKVISFHGINPRITKNRFINSKGKPALELESSSYAFVEDNEFEGNEIALLANDSRNLKARRNSFINNGTAIKVTGASIVFIENNYFRENKENSIIFLGEGKAKDNFFEVCQNDFIKEKSNVLLVQSESLGQSVFCKNNVSGVKEDKTGVLYFNGSASEQLELRNNYFEHISAPVFFNGFNNAKLSENTIVNSKFGVAGKNSENVLLEKNVIWGNQLGVYLINSSFRDSVNEISKNSIDKELIESSFEKN